MCGPHVHFRPVGRRVALRPGATLLDAVAEAGLPLARACGGDGLCARCGVWILRGGEALPPESAAEARAKRRNRVDPRLRLACRVAPTGPLEVTAPGWGPLGDWSGRSDSFAAPIPGAASPGGSSLASSAEGGGGDPC